MIDTTTPPARYLIDLYTIYERPKDAPNDRPFAVRRWLIVAGQANAQPADVSYFEDLDSARESFDSGNRLYFTRGQDDDPVILETWI